jgi:hypothetical protein
LFIALEKIQSSTIFFCPLGLDQVNNKRDSPAIQLIVVTKKIITWLLRAFNHTHPKKKKKE